MSSSLFTYQDPKAVELCIPIADPNSPYFVQNLAYLSWILEASCINDANPAKVIERCQCFKDIPFIELFDKV